MLDKIKNLLASSIKKIPASIGTKAIVYYAVVLAAEIILFNVAFCVNWWVSGWVSGKADVNTLIQFLTVLVGAQFTSAILMIGKGFVDSDGDGVPDVLEDAKAEIGFKTEEGETK